MAVGIIRGLRRHSRILRNARAVANPDHPNRAEAKEWLNEYDPKVSYELPINTPSAALRTGLMLPRHASRTTSKPHQQLSSRNQPPWLHRMVVYRQLDTSNYPLRADFWMLARLWRSL